LVNCRLGCPNETYQLFDFYHVTEHLQTFADVAFYNEKERKDWFKKARKTLKKGNALTLIRQMDEFIIIASQNVVKLWLHREIIFCAHIGKDV